MSRSSPSERPTLLRKASLRDIIDAQTVQRDAEALRNAPWYILRPTSTFMSVWDGVTSTALIFTAVVTPFEVSFLEPAETMLDGLWLINRLVDAIFVVDMALQFFLMYRHRRPPTRCRSSSRSRSGGRRRHGHARRRSTRRRRTPWSVDMRLMCFWIVIHF